MSFPLSIEVYAPLDVVGTEDYIRYGVNGLQRDGGTLTESISTPDRLSVKLEAAQADATTILTIDNLELKRADHLPLRTTVWEGNYEAVKVVWVWDFYRMLSYLRLVAEAEQPGLTDSLTAAHQVVLRVENAATQILQRHTIDRGQA